MVKEFKLCEMHIIEISRKDEFYAMYSSGKWKTQHINVSDSVSCSDMFGIMRKIAFMLRDLW